MRKPLLLILLPVLLLFGAACEASPTSATAVAATTAAAPKPQPVPIIAVHGYFDCSYDSPVGLMWQFLQAKTSRPVVSTAYYSCDKGGTRIPGTESFNSTTPIALIGQSLASWVKTTYGTRQVDFIGHSMGGLVIRAALKDSGVNVRNVVTLSTPHLGFDGKCSSVECAEMKPGSSFLASLGKPRGNWTVEGASACDVIPKASAIAIAGAKTYVYACMDHSFYLLSKQPLSDAVKGLGG